MISAGENGLPKQDIDNNWGCREVPVSGVFSKERYKLLEVYTKSSTFAASFKDICIFGLFRIPLWFDALPSDWSPSEIGEEVTFAGAAPVEETSLAHFFPSSGLDSWNLYNHL